MRVEGAVRFNGQAASVKRFKRLTGYVLQARAEDIHSLKRTSTCLRVHRRPTCALHLQPCFSTLSELHRTTCCTRP